MERTDEQLVRASIDGDPLSFGILVQRLRAPLIGYVTGLLGNKDDAEELAQDAFLIAWQKLPGLRVPARAKAWIYRVAHNLASKRRWQTRMEPLVDDPPAAITADQRPRRLISLLEAVGRLSEPHREVVSRKHFAGQSGNEIARQLGIPPGTVRSRLSRAYAELRLMLVEQESD